MPVQFTDQFPEIPSDVRLWRYVDLSKFLSMLTTGALWIPRSDQLGDPFEGAMSKRRHAEAMSGMPFMEIGMRG